MLAMRVALQRLLNDQPSSRSLRACPCGLWPARPPQSFMTIASPGRRSGSGSQLTESVEDAPQRLRIDVTVDRTRRPPLNPSSITPARRRGLADVTAFRRRGRVRHDRHRDQGGCRMHHEAVSRIDAIFAVEREIKGLRSAERQAARETRSRPIVEALHVRLRQNRAKLSAKAPAAKAIDYMLKRCWPSPASSMMDTSASLTTPRSAPSPHRGRPTQLDLRRSPSCGRHVHIDRICEAQRDRPASLARGGPRRLPDHPAKRIRELLPWNWSPPEPQALAT